MVEFRTLSDTEQVMKIYREFTNAVAFNDKNFNSSVESWRFYWGRDSAQGLGQWPANLASEMIREGRFLATYNFCQPIVDSIAGGLMKAPFNADFSPVDGPMLEVTSALKDKLIIDKEMTDWGNALRQVAIAGCVFEGSVEMYVNKEYSKLGDIGLRYRLPGSVIYDPYIKTGRHRDFKKCWVTNWMTPIQMMEMWADKTDLIASAVVERAKRDGKDVAPIIRSLAEAQARMGDEYGNNYGITPYLISDSTWGTQYRVIAEYRMVPEKISHEYAITAGEPVIIPGNLQDAADKMEWLNANVPEWQPDGIGVEEREENIQYVGYISPDLLTSTMLDSGKTEMQCGSLSHLAFSVNNQNGERAGIIGAIIDAQKSINNLQAMLTHKLQVEGGGGSQFVDPDGFRDEIEMKKYIRGRNNPRNAFVTQPGYLRKNPRGPATPTVTSQSNSEATQQLQQIIETILPRISKVSPAWQGRSESTNESGYLYRQKRIQSEIEQYTLYESWRQFHNELGEMYLYGAANHYGDGIQREVYNPKTKSTMAINEKVWLDGKETIRNNFSSLKYSRHRVIITESEDSPTRKYETMSVATEAMKALPPQMSLNIIKLGGMIAASIDQFTPEDQEEIKNLTEIEMAFAMQQMKTQTVNMKLQELSAIQQIRALAMAEEQNAMQGMGGGAPGGAPQIPMQGGQSSQRPGPSAPADIKKIPDVLST
jgi:hypothetical protein